MKTRHQLINERVLSDREQQALLELVPVSATDLEGTIIFWGRGMELLLGYSKKEALGRVGHELLKTKFPSAPKTIVAELLSHGRWEGELVYQDQNGLPVTVLSEWVVQGGENDGAQVILQTSRDITERKRAEENTRRTEELLSNIFSAVQGAIAVVEAIDDGRDFRFLSVNQVVVDATGLPMDFWVGKRPQDIFSPQDARAMCSRYRQMLEEGRSITYEERLTLPTRGLWALTTLTPLCERDGRISRLLVTSTEITQRKEAEEALRESEQRERLRAAELETVLNSVPAAVWIAHDPECRSITGNRTANQFLRVPEGGESSITAPDERRPRHFKPVKDGRDLRPEELPVQMAAHGLEVHDLEHDIQFSDGKILNLLGNATPLLDEAGQPRGAVAAFVDITERKRREFFSQERLRINRLIHSTLDTDTVMQTALSTAMSALGSESGAISLRKGGQWVASYVEGMPREVLGACVNDDEQRHALLAIQTQQAVAIHDAFNDVRVNRRHFQRWNLRSVLVVPMLNRREAVGVMFLNYHSAAHTFTQAEIEFGTELAATLTLALENGRLYAEVQQHAAKLEQTVRERTSQLQNAMAELEHFSHTITHDLRGPLRAMHGFAELMLHRDRGSLSDASSDLLRRIVRASRTMDKIISNALDFARASEASLQLAPVDLGKVLHAIVESYPNLQPPALEIILDGPLPRVLGNETAVNQCFANLLGNAVKFVTPGTRPRVRVWAEPKGAFSRIWLEDNGIGIPKGAGKDLFARCRQIHSGYEGTGLGLALVSRNMQKMEGQVGVVSEPGQGSRFWIEFKLAADG